MRNKILLFVLTLLTILITSCDAIWVGSFYPIYTEDVIITNDKLIGDWISTGDMGKDSMICKIRKYKIKEKDKKNEFDHYKYVMEVKSQNTTLGDECHAYLKLYLIKLKDELYADLSLIEKPECLSLIETVHLYPIHSVGKINISNDSLKIKFIDADWLYNLIVDGKIRISHEKNEDYLLLTEKPKKLQKFILKFSDRGAFETLAKFKKMNNE